MAKAAEARAGRAASAPAKGKGAGNAVPPVASRPSGRGKVSKAGGTRAKASWEVPAASLPAASKGGGALDAAVPPNRGPTCEATQRLHADCAAPTRCGCG